MALHKDTPLQLHNSTSLTEALTDGRKYYIVSVSNGADALSSVIDSSGGNIFQVGKLSNFNLGGAGFPVDRFKCNASTTFVFYYIR